jgi:hypothetical protein
MASVDPAIYAVGDIHGYADLLDDLLQQIERDAVQYAGRPIEVVFVGDYVDRGPDSRGVIARLRNWQPGFALTFLKGNHEQLLAQAVMEPGLEFGPDMGQDETFASYLGHEDDLARDLFWMTELPLTKMLETGGTKFLFVHDDHRGRRGRRQRKLRRQVLKFLEVSLDECRPFQQILWQITADA